MTMATVYMLLRRGLDHNEPQWAIAAAIYTLADQLGQLKEVLERKQE
jgi:hypothetical protein